MEKLVITVAPTGNAHTRENHPQMPLTPEEIADSVCDAYRAGAVVAHLHVRDEDGKPSMASDKFFRAAELIRERCDILINFTTSGASGRATEDDRVAHLAFKPDLCSFNAGSINFGEKIFQNSPAFMRRVAQAALDAKIKPEIEIFDTAMIESAVRLAKEGLLIEPLHFQFVLGVRGGLSATPKNLLFMLESIPQNATWSAVGIGKMNFFFTVMCIGMGGHVRVGTEDNVWYRKGVLASSNAQFVERVVKLAEEFDRPVATVAEARKILNLPDRSGL